MGLGQHMAKYVVFLFVNIIFFFVVVFCCTFNNSWQRQQTRKNNATNCLKSPPGGVLNGQRAFGYFMRFPIRSYNVSKNKQNVWGCGCMCVSLHVRFGIKWLITPTIPCDWKQIFLLLFAFFLWPPPLSGGRKCVWICWFPCFGWPCLVALVSLSLLSSLLRWSLTVYNLRC